jgi:putative FmdB family regulatory protein
MPELSEESGMPTYDYECTKCSWRSEVKRSFGENGAATCPRCEGDARRIFSPVPVFFKGPGFYVTDSARKAKSPASGSARDDEAPKDTAVT